MPHIAKEHKEQMLAMMDKAESYTRNFRSIAAEMYKFAPQKLNTSQKNKVRTIAEHAADLIVKGIPEARKGIKKHYTAEDWERDKKIVDEVLSVGTGRIILHAQEILNLCNGQWGVTLEQSKDEMVVPTLKLAMAMIRNACDMVNYCEECLSEALHDNWDLIVELDEIVPEKSLERYRKAVAMLDADMRKAYESKKKSLEKTYGQAIHRSVCPDFDYYIDDTNIDKAKTNG